MESGTSISALDNEHILHTYRRYPGVFVRGEGCYVWDESGTQYLDFLMGIAVNQLGHCHPAIVEAITKQASTLMHTSNLMLTPPVAELAQKLTQISGLHHAFFAVCGSTANEAALKIAKAHGLKKCPSGDYELIALKNSFHGRTCGVLSLTYKEAYRLPFQPLLPNIKFIEPNDIDQLKNAFSDKTAGIVLEPIQGEGGVLPLTKEFLMASRELCDKHDALLMLDEVQTGLARTGKWFAYQHHQVMPDTLALAKALGCGMPIGACVVSKRAASILNPGEHGSTFGGNPLMCAASLAVINTIESQNLVEHAQVMGDKLMQALRESSERVLEVRGKGLMIGVIFDKPIARQVVQESLKQGLIINATDDYKLRILPPLIIQDQQVQEATGKLKNAILAC